MKGTAPDRERYPLFYGWFRVVRIFSPEVVAQWADLKDQKTTPNRGSCEKSQGQRKAPKKNKGKGKKKGKQGKRGKNRSAGGGETEEFKGPEGEKLQIYCPSSKMAHLCKYQKAKTGRSSEYVSDGNGGFVFESEIAKRAFETGKAFLKVHGENGALFIGEKGEI